MSKNYKLSNDAKEDLRRIYAYGFNLWGVEQADKYFDNFFLCFNEISKQPEQYQSVDHIRKGYRRCVCGIDSIYYRVKNNNVEIMNIIGSQDYDL